MPAETPTPVSPGAVIESLRTFAENYPAEAACLTLLQRSEGIRCLNSAVILVARTAAADAGTDYHQDKLADLLREALGLEKTFAETVTGMTPAESDAFDSLCVQVQRMHQA